MTPAERRQRQLAPVRSTIYVKAPAGRQLRDRAVQRLAAKLRQALSWLTPSDLPAARAWCEIEVLRRLVFREVPWLPRGAGCAEAQGWQHGCGGRHSGELTAPRRRGRRENAASQSRFASGDPFPPPGIRLATYHGRRGASSPSLPGQGRWD